MAVPMEDWRMPEKRRMVIQKLEEACNNCQPGVGLQQSPQELEQMVFDKAKTKEEYNHSLQQFLLRLARGSRRPGMQQGVSAMPPGVVGQTGANMMPQGQMGMNPQGTGYSQNQFTQYSGGMRPDMGMGQSAQPPSYSHPMYQRAGVGPRPNQMMGQMRMSNQQVYPSAMMGQGGYSAMQGPPRYNVHPNLMNTGMQIRAPGMRPVSGVPSMGIGMSGSGIGMSAPMQNVSSSNFQGHSVQTISNPSYSGSNISQSFSQAPPIGVPPSSRPEVPPTSVPASTSSSADQSGVKGQQIGPGGNPPTPHPPSMSGGVPSPAPPTPLLPASPATSSVGSPAPQPIITPEENEVYMRKLAELQKYIPLLQKWISKLTKDDKNNQLPKLKQLYHLLTNSNKRVPITTLMRCGEALDKMLSSDQASRETHPSVSSDAPTPQPRATPPTPHSEPPVVPAPKLLEPRHSPSLLEFKIPPSPPANYESLLEAIHSRPLPPERLPPAKRMCNRDEPTIPNTLMRELATISNVRVKRIPNESQFDKSTVLHCTLDDDGLPSVPSLTVRIPSSYPLVSPICDLSPYHTSTSSTLVTEVGRTLSDRLSRSVHTYSLSSLLSDWEMCVLRAVSKQLSAVESSI